MQARDRDIEAQSPEQLPPTGWEGEGHLDTGSASGRISRSGAGQSPLLTARHQVPVGPPSPPLPPADHEGRGVGFPLSLPAIAG